MSTEFFFLAFTWPQIEHALTRIILENQSRTLSQSLPSLYKSQIDSQRFSLFFSDIES